jgi:hypothetical protein
MWGLSIGFFCPLGTARALVFGASLSHRCALRSGNRGRNVEVREKPPLFGVSFTEIGDRVLREVRNADSLLHVARKERHHDEWEPADRRNDDPYLAAKLPGLSQKDADVRHVQVRHFGQRPPGRNAGLGCDRSNRSC